MRIWWSNIAVGYLEQSGSRRSDGGWRACRRRSASSLFDILPKSLFEGDLWKDLRLLCYGSVSCNLVNYLGRIRGHGSKVQQSDQRRRLKIAIKFCTRDFPLTVQQLSQISPKIIVANTNKLSMSHIFIFLTCFPIHSESLSCKQMDIKIWPRHPRIARTVTTGTEKCFK